MEKYRNLGGSSGVSRYEVRDDSIVVEFSTGAKYIYSRSSCGEIHLSKLIGFAKAGRGLNSYINRNCKDCGRKL